MATEIVACVAPGRCCRGVQGGWARLEAPNGEAVEALPFELMGGSSCFSANYVDCHCARQQQKQQERAGGLMDRPRNAGGVEKPCACAVERKSDSLLAEVPTAATTPDQRRGIVHRRRGVVLRIGDWRCPFCMQAQASGGHIDSTPNKQTGMWAPYVTQQPLVARRPSHSWLALM